jgi:hypothetical protein
MVNQEILEGIRRAVYKGESLRDAMMSFYNSGYKKADIEEAARAFQAGQFQNRTQSHEIPNPIKNVNFLTQQIKSLAQDINKPQEQPKMVQKVSNYEKVKEGLSNKVWIIILSIILLLLLGGLIASFLFKQELIDFFTKIFGS